MRGEPQGRMGQFGKRGTEKRSESRHMWLFHRSTSSFMPKTRKGKREPSFMVREGKRGRSNGKIIRTADSEMGFLFWSHMTQGRRKEDEDEDDEEEE